jgi:carboxylesterase type B
MYEFAWRSPQMGGRLGAAHGVEIPFVFDTLGLGTMRFDTDFRVVDNPLARELSLWKGVQ